MNGFGLEAGVAGERDRDETPAGAGVADA
jgi:hypothetical protein